MSASRIDRPAGAYRGLTGRGEKWGSSHPAITLYPAIDLKGGACVRLRRGEIDEATVYSDNPAGQAKAFQDEGAAWLHIVDLDGAFAGQAVNAPAVTAILAATTIPVQLGGGIRDMAAIARWIDAGVARLILGSAALKNPALVRQACAAYPGQIAVGIDARDGFVATEGWAQTSTTTAADLACRLEDAGVAAIIYTDIARDGMLSGLNLDQTAALAQTLATPVIASGGVGGPADLRAFAAAAAACPNLQGVIVGRALYDGRVRLAEALAILADQGRRGEC